MLETVLPSHPALASIDAMYSFSTTSYIDESAAGLDAQTGLCCPVGLRDVLTRSFQLADHRLLDHLAGALANFPPSPHIHTHMVGSSLPAYTHTHGTVKS